MSSPDILSENVEKIAALFPNCVTETAGGKAIDCLAFLLVHSRI